MTQIYFPWLPKATQMAMGRGVDEIPSDNKSKHIQTLQIPTSERHQHGANPGMGGIFEN